jgi:hypothetical protein
MKRNRTAVSRTEQEDAEGAAARETARTDGLAATVAG